MIFLASTDIGKSEEFLLYNISPHGVWEFWFRHWLISVKDIFFLSTISVVSYKNLGVTLMFSLIYATCNILIFKYRRGKYK